MVKRIDLHESPETRLARILLRERSAAANLATGPTGVKHLGENGDVVWDGKELIPDPENPGGPPIEGPSYVTWSVKDVPVITETLHIELQAAEDRIDQAASDLDAAQSALDSVTLDISTLTGQVGQAASDAAAAQAAASAAQDAADDAAQDAADALAAAQNASGKQQIYFGATAPTGDPDVLWIDQDGVPHQWDGSGWVEITDTRIVAAAAAASAANDAAVAAAAAAATAQATADSKVKTYFQNDAPTVGLVEGDLWIDTNDQNHTWRWDGDSWEDARDQTIQAAAAAASAANTAASNALTAAQAAQATADGAIRTYYQANPPWANGSTQPASVLGDMWFDQDDGQAYRWNGTTWQVIEDSSIAAALAAAQSAQTTADGKITAYYQDNQPTTGEVGDLWYDTNDKNKPYYCSSIAPLTWTPISDGRIADAAAAAATALASANGRNSRIISLSAASGTVHPTTGNALVTGDTWWQWDNTTDRNVIGAWVWDGDSWKTELLTDSVLGSLDVNKLMVLGVARMTEAVVAKIIGDAAYFNLLNVEDLIVTDEALINSAVVLALAARQIETGGLRTEVDTNTGLYAIMDSFGFRVIDNAGGPEGEPQVIVALGPDGEQLIQLGQGDNMVSINSSGGVTARTASVRDLWLDGHRLEVRDLLGGPRGIVSQAVMFPGRSRRLNGRDIVLGLEGTLRPGRVYKLECSSFVVDTEHGTCEPFAQLHRTIDGSAPQFDWGASAVKESKIGPYAGFRTLPGLIHWIDLTHLDADGPDVPLRAALSLGNFAGNGWVQAAAVVDRIWLVCEDWGSTFVDRGTPFYIDGGSSGTPPPVRQTQRWTASGMATYVRGGSRDESGGHVQGQYSSWNRETLFVFPSMTATLAGATIHRITCRSFFDSWYYSDGGTGSWCWHGETGIPASSPAKTFMVDTAGWPRGAGREINIIPEEYADWQSGTRRGFMFSTPVTAWSHYGRLSSDLNQHWVEVEFSK